MLMTNNFRKVIDIVFLYSLPYLAIKLINFDLPFT